MRGAVGRKGLWFFAIISLIVFISASGCAGTTFNNTTANPLTNSTISTTEPATRSIISGNISDNFDVFHAVGGVLVMAIPADGGTPVKTVSDDHGNFSLNVRPGIPYMIAGIAYDAYGQYAHVIFRYSNGNFIDNITLAPGETIIIKSEVSRVHPPVPMIWAIDPKTGGPMPLSHAPVTVRGHVYLDGKPVSNATVEAVSVDGGDRTFTFTVDNGAYAMDIGMNTQYSLTASYKGYKHTVWPVYRDTGESGTYDINLTSVPSTVILGIAADDEPWLRRPGSVTAEVTPIFENIPINATTGNDSRFSIDVEPYVYYNITGSFRALYSKDYNTGFAYLNGVSMTGFMLRPNETALIFYYTYERVDEPETNGTK